MIIPYGHEHTTVRRLPWVTIAIMALCLVVFLPVQLEQRVAATELNRELEKILVYYVQHPYLEMPGPLRELLQPVLGEEALGALPEAMRQFGERAPEDERLLADQQSAFEDMVGSFIGRLGNTPYHRWGLVPGDQKLHSYITYQFVHAGWLHLLGNLLFLFITAPFVEDVWGRPLFGGFYLAAGVAAAGMYALHYPSLMAPLVGASGSIAGVMAAFLIRYWNTRVRFLLWLIVPAGPFQAPAWMVFPMWFLWELLMGQAMDTVAPGGGGSGVAHWAHVWGFIFGLVVAGAVKYYGVEEKYLHRAIESKITLMENSAVEAALEAASQGKTEEAFEGLRTELRLHPENIDAAIAYWHLASHRNRASEAAPHLVRALKTSARSDDPSLILNHWTELLETVPDIRLDPALAARAAEILHQSGRDLEVEETVERARSWLRPDSPSGVLIRLARLAATVRAPVASAFARAAVAHPETPEDVRSELAAVASEDDRSRPPDDETPSASLDTPKLARISRTLQIMECVPRGLDGDTLAVEARGEHRRFALQRIQAVAVAGVRREGERPFLVIDLLLDGPWSDSPKLRVVRLRGPTFDPRQLVGGENAIEAFRTLVERILEASEAVPLPDPEAVRGRPFHSYPSVETYQSEVLGVPP